MTTDIDDLIDEAWRATTTRSQAIRQKQLAWRLLNNLESLTFVPALRWLKVIRIFLWIGAGVAYGLGLRMDALLLSVVALIVEVMLFRVQVVEVLKAKAE